ncbi:hypothetical protein HYC85_020268 [Camellia sinensis]|uniref:Uncharacterized protein n=1 Tax=Camellia sinensis TaxID=4442 RepID=A0A7J7GSY8_CAMSI|nr:hypothetical protein HYC85_020268 [Camellia sinensis]
MASFVGFIKWVSSIFFLVNIFVIVIICLMVQTQIHVMIKNLEQVVNVVLNSFQDPYHRLSSKLGPDSQVQYHQHLLPALVTTMDDFQNPRIQEICKFNEKRRKSRFSMREAKKPSQPPHRTCGQASLYVRPTTARTAQMGS